jgi:hypothetical protein
MPVDVVLAGHGEPVRDHAALIDERVALHERWARKIGGLIAERPRPRTSSRRRCGGTSRSRRPT